MRGEGFGVCREGVGKKEMGGEKEEKEEKEGKRPTIFARSRSIQRRRFPFDFLSKDNA